MSRRTIALVAAVALAAVATVALISYIQGVREEALGEGEQVEVYVAKEAIPSGTSAEAAISRGLIDRTQVPRKVVAEGAIGTLTEIQGKVAGVSILKGEQIISGRFVNPGQAREGGLTVPNSRQAMSVEVAVVPGVAGFVQPGDRISILAQLAVPRGAATENHVQFLLQAIEVLQVGQRVITPEGKEATQNPAEKVVVTLAVTASQAERLAYAIFNGKLYFTLLPEGQQPVSTSGRNIRNVFP